MPATTADPSGQVLREELRGLDRLELALPQRKSRARRVWSALWPKLAAVALALAISAAVKKLPAVPSPEPGMNSSGAQVTVAPAAQSSQIPWK